MVFLQRANCWRQKLSNYLKIAFYSRAAVRTQVYQICLILLAPFTSLLLTVCACLFGFYPPCLYNLHVLQSLFPPSAETYIYCYYQEPHRYTTKSYCQSIEKNCLDRIFRVACFFFSPVIYRTYLNQALFSHPHPTMTLDSGEVFLSVFHLVHPLSPPL